jgi:hypothetical protein
LIVNGNMRNIAVVNSTEPVSGQQFEQNKGGDGSAEK